MNSNTMIRKLIAPGLVLGALGLAAAPVAAVDLAAKAFTMTMPDGSSVPMWGFVLDDAGCFATTPTSVRLTCVAGLPDPTAPGPRLVAGAAGGNITIRLTNTLPEPVSIVIPGQEMPSSTNCSTPVWTDGSSGARTSPSQRVRSFGCEAGTGGGREVYRWTSALGTQFQPGTYIYQSGSHQQLQVHMGLYGAIRRNVAASEAYTNVTFDMQRDLFYSEVDPALHSSLTAANSGNYNPEHFLLQRYTNQTTVVDASIDPSSTACIPTGGLAAGESLLLRLYNAGLRQLKPMMIGSHFDVVAEGGKPYQFARNQYSALLPPMSTRDLLWTPDEGGTFPLIERGLSLTDAGPVFGTVPGGQQTCFTIGAAIPQAVTADTLTCKATKYKVLKDRVVVKVVTDDLTGNLTMNASIDVDNNGVFEPLGLLNLKTGTMNVYKKGFKEFADPNPTASSMVKVTSSLGGTCSKNVTIVN